MRIFIGLPISEKLQQEILDWKKQFSNLPVRWLQGKNLHITLIPPWYVEEESQIGADQRRIHADTLGDIKNALQKVAGEDAFEIKFERVTFGPDLRRPRLIWVEGETPKELLDLQQKLQKIFGKEPERRPLKLHLTIARFRPEHFSSFSIKDLDEKVDWQDKVERVVLFESRLSREGADYKVLKEVYL